MNNFTPTYLYIKQHNITGKIYFGKTIKYPEKYLGSGTHWRRHIKKHSEEHVETLWYCLFFDKETISEFALMCSTQWNIVESKEWLNKIPENGLDGACSGVPTGPRSDETKLKISVAMKGKSKGPCSDETKLKMSIAHIDVLHTEETKLKMSIAKLGVPKSEETKKKMCISRNNRPPCSDETKLKMAVSANNRPPCSDETKLKMAVAQKKRHAAKNL